MFLSGQWLEENGAGLFTPFNRGQIDCAAYAMRVGREAYVSPEDQNSRSSPIMSLGHEQPLSIPPGQFAFLISREFVRVPSDLIAFINIKFGLKVQGLVNVSGFHVDPGYKGHLVFAVFNAGPKTIVLRHNDLAFLIWFARLEKPSDKHAKTGTGYLKIDSDLVARVPFQGVSLSSLGARIERLETVAKFATWALGTLVVVVILGIGVAVAGDAISSLLGVGDGGSVRPE